MYTFATERLIAATPAAIFAAIQDPTRLARWWGPDGFSNQFEIFEFREGGSWIFTMHGPDGTVYPNQSQFRRIVPDQQVVIRHLSQPHFQLTITLQPHAQGTLLQWQQVFDDDNVAKAVRHIVEPANEQNLDRLTAEVLAGI